MWIQHLGSVLCIIHCADLTVGMYLEIVGHSFDAMKPEQIWPLIEEIFLNLFFLFEKNICILLIQISLKYILWGFVHKMWEKKKKKKTGSGLTLKQILNIV